MRKNGCDSTLPRSTRCSLILQTVRLTITTHTMRAVDYVTNGFGGGFSDLFKNLGYQLFSPSGSSSPIGSGPGRVRYDLQSQFGNVAARFVPYGLNPRFIDIVRGPSGRDYLVRAINFLGAYIQMLQRGSNPNAAYNTASMRIGTSSPLTPSKQFLVNLNSVDASALFQLGEFYQRVLASL